MQADNGQVTSSKRLGQGFSVNDLSTLFRDLGESTGKFALWADSKGVVHLSSEDNRSHTSAQIVAGFIEFDEQYRPEALAGEDEKLTYMWKTLTDAWKD